MDPGPQEPQFTELLPSGFVAVEREPRPLWRRLAAALRAVVAGLLALLVAALAAASTVGLWTRDQLLDTDAYVAAVAPVAASSTVQDDVAALVADAVLTELAGTDLPASVRGQLAGPVRDAARELVRRPEFVAVWTAANRAGHDQVVRLLRGDSRPVPGASVVDGRLQVDLSAAVEPVRQQVQAAVDAAVAASGLPVAAPQLPRTELVVDAGDVSGLDRLQRYVTWADRSATYGPWAAAGLTVLAVLVARRRLRMLAVVAFGVVVAMVAVRVALHLGTTEALARLDAAGVSSGAGPAVVDRLTSVLRDVSRGVGIGASVVLALAGVAAVAAASRRPRRPAAVGAGTDPVASSPS